MNEAASEEEEDLYRIIMRSSHECAVCAENICLTDEIVAITVVKPVFRDGAIALEPLDADDGDFAYEPRFVEYECWEDVVDELYSSLCDNPPIEDQYAVLFCRICESGIRLDETCGCATRGEVHCSQRMPEGIPTETFDAQDPKPDVICITCINALCADYIDLWESVEQGEECGEGREIRCWRHGCPGRQGCILGIK